MNLAARVEKLAEAGATIVVSDIIVEAGQETAKELSEKINKPILDNSTPNKQWINK